MGILGIHAEDDPPFAAGLRIEPVDASDRRAALQLIFAELDAPRRDEAVAEALRAIRGCGSAKHVVYAAWRDQRMLGATWLEIRPGRVASLWPPGLALGESEPVATQLIDFAAEHAIAAGAIVVQSLVKSQDCREADWFRASRFRHAAEVICMTCDQSRFPRQAPICEFDMQPYSDVFYLRLRAVLARTYENSRDCPAMQNVRSIDDVLASYRAAGQFDPNHWLIARHEGRDVGCLLITRHFNHDWELAYLGVIPEVRGRRFGLQLARRAQWLAAEAGAAQIMLAVDAANTPAIAAYTSAGFESHTPSSVFSRITNSQDMEPKTT